MMTTDYLAVRDSMPVREAIEAIRRAGALGEDWLYVFVVDWRGRLQGRATMRALLLANPAQRVTEVSEKRVDAVKPDVEREEVAREFEKYDYLVLPVVDDEDRMLGVITVDDVVDAIRQESTEDAQAMVGAGREEAVFSSVADKLRGRLPWLFVNLFTSSLAAIVVLQFDDLIGSIAILAVIMPVIANQAGNAGQQSLAVTMRGIVLDEVREGAALGLVRREALVGLVNGTICGLIVGSIVAMIEYFHQPDAAMWKLGVVVAIAMTLALSVGTLVGSSLPLVVRRLGADPATASTIFLTMVTDSMSFLAFLGLSYMLSGWIGITIAAQ
jgi:magnesium transporter